jgi:hypothetical protein
MTLPLLWWRTATVAAVVGVIAALLLHAALFNPVVRCGIIFPVGFVLAFAAGSRLHGREALAALGLVWVLDLVVCLTDADAGADVAAMTFVAPVTAAVWWVGRLVRSRSQMIGELETRTGELRHARDERSRLEVMADRARLSSELDELLHRRLGELARLADAGARPGDATEMKAALVDIEHESRRTLDEMRELVGVLRDDGAAAPTSPQPTLTHLDALLVRVKGSDARLTVEGSPRVLPAGVELSAYRVVEQLLAALEDASDIEVRVRFTDDALELVVSGATRRQGAAAIERARERVRLQRGTFHTATHGGRAEAVASLPMFARG